MNYLENYQTWCEAALSEDLRLELLSLAGQESELQSRFGGELQFGTAGMRGLMGVGSNRLNRYTVRRAAQGMAAWLFSTDLPKKAAIAYDSRHNSQVFAETCAVAFGEAGIQVWLYDRLAPTPMLSYAVRQLGCGCGVVISASHNAGSYNGVKCYGPDGCQMTDEPAAVVIEKIKNIPYFEAETKSFQALLEEGTVHYIPQSLWESYYQSVLNEALEPQVISDSGLRVVYTPLCGTGNEPVREVLNRLGAKVTVVRVQELPDGDFKTCEYPNPETDAALNESYHVARTVPCDVILGTDPDCDRVAIAVPAADGFQKLTGNELGCLLLDYVLKTKSANGSLPQEAEVVRSIVTTPLADRIASHYGCRMITVLTGFKYIGGEILRLELLDQVNRFIFGFEESCGYLKGTFVRDKDAVVASMLVCEMAAALKKEGLGILDALEQLYQTYGVYLTQVQSIELTGVDAMQKAAARMEQLREQTPEQIGGSRVTVVRDYLLGTCRGLTGGDDELIALPKSNVLELLLDGGNSVIVRPSGTEPKIKYYYTAVASTRPMAEAKLSAMIKQMNA